MELGEDRRGDVKCHPPCLATGGWYSRTLLNSFRWMVITPGAASVCRLTTTMTAKPTSMYDRPRLRNFPPFFQCATSTHLAHRSIQKRTRFSFANKLSAIAGYLPTAPGASVQFSLIRFGFVFSSIHSFVICFTFVCFRFVFCVAFLSLGIYPAWCSRQ